MQTIHRFVLVLAGCACPLLVASGAHAARLVVAGTPEQEQGIVVGSGVHPGIQAEVNGGSGFSDLYNFGFGGRLGFTTRQGIYLGANADHFVGDSAAGYPHNTLVGGEAGLKIFPHYRWEVRPYAFAGAEIPSTGGKSFALAPGVVGAYHFGRGFVDVDGRYLVTPNPPTFMLLGGAGLAF